ncbi:hypothetical protein PQR12_18525 [Paraburkholderia nemoris]|uniref:hypothetical protein n=1 Tax=Paraburkholderia nemoris TaxID=2793076 RepID=UPI0038BB367F
MVFLILDLPKAELPDLQRDLQVFGGATLVQDACYITLGIKARYMLTVGESFLERFPRWKPHIINQ